MAPSFNLGPWTPLSRSTTFTSTVVEVLRRGGSTTVRLYTELELGTTFGSAVLCTLQARVSGPLRSRNADRSQLIFEGSPTFGSGLRHASGPLTVTQRVGSHCHCAWTWTSHQLMSYELQYSRQAETLDRDFSKYSGRLCVSQNALK